jgi:hypothetical protein
MLYNEPHPFRSPLQDVHDPVADLAPIFAYVAEAYRQPLMNDNVRYINANETTIQPTTVQAHIEDIYTPGDRLDGTKQRRVPHRRQAPRVRGYPCQFDGCEKTFDRACELK